MLDEGRNGFSGRLRNSIAFWEGEELPTLFMIMAGYTCHNVVPIDCHLFGSLLLKFVSPFR